MSKLSNLLNMYILLQGRSLMKVKELAEIIEVSERTIKGYKDDLEKAGIYISTKSGRYGGYYLENKLSLEGLEISEEEIEALQMANEIIRSGNYIFSLDFEKLACKITNHKNSLENVDFYMKERLRPEAMKEKEKENWNLIKKACINTKKIEIDYSAIDHKDRKNKQSVRIVHPYGTFTHDGSVYMYAYCEKRREIRHFKLSRINSIKIIKDNFIIDKKYDIKKEMRKSFGIIDDDVFQLKLKIKYPMSQLVKEKKFTSDQKIKDLDEDTILYEAKLKGYREVKTWVLSMGSHVEVLEPMKLKQDILNEIKKMKELYNGTLDLHQSEI